MRDEGNVLYSFLPPCYGGVEQRNVDVLLPSRSTASVFQHKQSTKQKNKQTTIGVFGVDSKQVPIPVSWEPLLPRVPGGSLYPLVQAEAAQRSSQTPDTDVLLGGGGCRLEASQDGVGTALRHFERSLCYNTEQMVHESSFPLHQKDLPVAALGADPLRQTHLGNSYRTLVLPGLWDGGMHAFWTAVKFRHEHGVEMPSPIKTGAFLDMKQGITLKHTWSLQGYLVLFKITSLDVTLHLSPHSCVHGSAVEPVNISLLKCRHALVYLGNEKLEDRQHLRKLQRFNIWVVWYLMLSA